MFGDPGEAHQTVMNRLKSLPVVRVVAASIVFVAMLTGYAFWRHHGQITDGVHVITDADPLRCEATDVTRAPIQESSDFAAAFATLDPEMECELRFFIRNETGHDITVKTISVPLLGPRGGGGARATTLLPFGTSPLHGHDDGIWNVDDLLFAGDQRGYTVGVEFRPDGCSPANSTTWLDWPNVTVTSWGMDVALDPETVRVGFIGSEDSSCDL